MYLMGMVVEILYQITFSLDSKIIRLMIHLLGICGPTGLGKKGKGMIRDVIYNAS